MLTAVLYGWLAGDLSGRRAVAVKLSPLHRVPLVNDL